MLILLNIYQIWTNYDWRRRHPHLQSVWFVYLFIIYLLSLNIHNVKAFFDITFTYQLNIDISDITMIRLFYYSSVNNYNVIYCIIIILLMNGEWLNMYVLIYKDCGYIFFKEI